MAKLLAFLLVSLALVLGVQPVSADQDCAALRHEARAFMQTAMGTHRLVLWEAQGWPVEHRLEAWEVWERYQQDPVAALRDDVERREQEWVRRYRVTLAALDC